MDKQVRLIRIFFAAPGDVERERTIANTAINNWNVTTGQLSGSRAELVEWKSHAHPAQGDRPQAIINRQILDDSDVVVGIFWSHFGTPTGRALSGTEEEIRRSIKQHKPVLLYFSDCPLQPSHLDRKQFARINSFKQEFKDRGLYWTYRSSREFGKYFPTHLSLTLNPFVQSTKREPEEPRLRVAIGIVRRSQDILMVRRRIPDGGLAWQFPAGIIKPREAGQKALIDEVRKETGVTCRITSFLGERLHPNTNVRSEYYHCKYVRGRAANRDAEENSEVKWVDAAKVSAYVTSDLYEPIKILLSQIVRESK
jgi:8-oxo-dGTP pyrophosphatase MutT (NUDIX family)